MEDTLWAEAIEKEVDSLYNKYKLLPTSYQKAKKYQKDTSIYPLLWTFAVKYDGRRRARCVAGGHVTPDLEVDMYSGVVDLEDSQAGLHCCKATRPASFIQQTLVQHTSKPILQRRYTLLLDLNLDPKQGQKLIIDKALYGLKSAGASWHAKLADHLCDMGFRPSKADYNLWIRPERRSL